MNEEIREENKKEDKKFLGKFILILIGAFLVGAVSGLGMFVLKDATNVAVIVSEVIYKSVITVAPFVSIVFVAVMGTALFITHRKASEIIKAWDGEDEETYGKVDMMLSNVLSALNIGTVIVYFFFAIGFQDIVKRNILVDCCYFFGFLATLVVIIVGESAIVKLTKEMNPEKKGSVYDVKFVDKWEESCDEAEKLLIYKSAYMAYSRMNALFVGLWIFCVFGNTVFDFGLMPVTMVSVIWLCQICFYTYYCRYYAKHPEKMRIYK